MSTWLKRTIIGGVLSVFLLIGGCTTFYANYVYVENYQLGYLFDATNGRISALDRSGWHKKRMFVQSINTVDLRPFQVCISANQRVLNCKLVRFNPEGIGTFVSWHGRDDYVLSGSNNSSSSSTGGFEDIMRSYAYDGSGRTYPFLMVIRELRNDDATLASPLGAQSTVQQ